MSGEKRLEAQTGFACGRHINNPKGKEGMAGAGVSALGSSPAPTT